MRRLILNIHIEDKVKVDKFEVPAEQTLVDLLPNLVKGLGLDEKNGNGTEYWLEADTGILDSHKTLDQLGIKNEALLYLKSGKSIPNKKSNGLKNFEGKFRNGKQEAL